LSSFSLTFPVKIVSHQINVVNNPVIIFVTSIFTVE
jgi:hypothetical protein